MGGYLCVTTVASADQYDSLYLTYNQMLELIHILICRWKFGQIRPGDTIQFRRVDYNSALGLENHINTWLETIFAYSIGFNAPPIPLLGIELNPPAPLNPVLHVIPSSGVVRRRCDSSSWKEGCRYRRNMQVVLFPSKSTKMPIIRQELIRHPSEHVLMNILNGLRND